MRYSKDLLGTTLIISSNENILQTHIDICIREVVSFEKKYSRFIPNNFLYNLNSTKSSQCDGELFSLLQLTQKVSQITNGYFDITVLPLLENMGYGISMERVTENIGYQNIEFTKEKVTLHNGISIEFGSVGKGYLVDKIFNILDKFYSTFSINFGGDIRVKGKKEIFLEDPKKQNCSLGTIILDNLSIASSSGEKRKTGKGHHIINPKTKKNSEEILTLFVTHRLSSFSDIFSTALFVTPLTLSLKILNSTPGLEGCIIAKNGEIYKSDGFNCTFNETIG